MRSIRRDLIHDFLVGTRYVLQGTLLGSVMLGGTIGSLDLTHTHLYEIVGGVAGAIATAVLFTKFQIWQQI